MEFSEYESFFSQIFAYFWSRVKKSNYRKRLKTYKKNMSKIIKLQKRTIYCQLKKTKVSFYKEKYILRHISGGYFFTGFFYGAQRLSYIHKSTLIIILFSFKFKVYTAAITKMCTDDSYTVYIYKSFKMIQCCIISTERWNVCYEKNAMA